MVGVPIRNGWKRFHIPSMELSLASNRQLLPIPGIGQRITMSSGITEYAGYGAKGPRLRSEIVAHWLRINTSLDHVSKLELSYWQKLHPGYTRSWISPTVVGGTQASLVTVEFPYKKYRWVLKEAVFFKGNAHYFLFGMYPKLKDGWAEGAYEYILNSVRFDRP